VAMSPDGRCVGSRRGPFSSSVRPKACFGGPTAQRAPKRSPPTKYDAWPPRRPLSVPVMVPLLSDPVCSKLDNGPLAQDTAAALPLGAFGSLADWLFGDSWSRRRESGERCVRGRRLQFASPSRPFGDGI
jgi:hypothetical protein